MNDTYIFKKLVMKKQVNENIEDANKSVLKMVVMKKRNG